jgi:hypothetical protein
MNTEAGTVRLKVFNPSAKVKAAAKNAPRLDTLHGKRVAFSHQP